MLTLFYLLIQIAIGVDMLMKGPHVTTHFECPSTSSSHIDISNKFLKKHLQVSIKMSGYTIWWMTVCCPFFNCLLWSYSKTSLGSIL